ncbi:MAG: hypothetical protein FWG98_02425 [Candidatus Cloacimonetes bacterium]|nr:hypothetical protein [Candidatus Cloacimonadota bacterium]
MRFNYFCPFCFETVPVSHIQFICDDKACPKVLDEVAKEYDLTLAEAPEKNIVFSPKLFCITHFARNIEFYLRFIFFKKQVKCPTADCGKKTRKMVCPHCHNQLHENIVKNNIKIIIMAGQRGIGKTTYRNKLINEIFKDKTLRSYLPYTINFQTNIDSSINEEVVKSLELKQTTSSAFINGKLNKKHIRPILLSLKYIKNKEITIAFYDVAGEDLENFRNMKRSLPYSTKANAVFSIISWEKEERDEYAPYEHIADPDEKPMSLSIIESLHQLLPNRNIPYAIAVSKIYSDDNIDITGTSIDQVSPHLSTDNQRFLESDGNSVDSEVKQKLKFVFMHAITEFISYNYKKPKFFAYDALGKNASVNQQPHRLEDAFLWIMTQLGLYPKS